MRVGRGPARALGSRSARDCPQSSPEVTFIERFCMGIGHSLASHSQRLDSTSSIEAFIEPSPAALKESRSTFSLVESGL